MPWGVNPLPCRAVQRALVFVIGSVVASAGCETREHVLATVTSPGSDGADASATTSGSAGATAIGPESTIELVVNGDFKDGDTGFGTDYQPFSGADMAEGEYVVTDRTSGRHFLVTSDVPDHGGDGFMLMINSAPEADVAVWKQPVPLAVGAVYRMTVWVRHWLDEIRGPFDYQVRADGEVVGRMQQEEGLDSTGWTRLRLQWTSRSSGEILVALFNMDLTEENNDHFLDDISLVELAP